MKKTIILSENAFNKIKNLIIKEATSDGPIFGKVGTKSYINYAPHLKSISNITNLHNDRYKDYELENAYNDWKNTGYDKNREEYIIYKAKFQNFMCSFIDNISYTSERLNCPLHELIIDPKWIPELNKSTQWKYSDMNTWSGGDQWQCFYTTVLKIFQNPVIWNDLFFNPQFARYKQSFDNVLKKLDDQMKENIERYKTLYKPLLPGKELAQIRNFIKGVIVTNGKIEKVNNAKPELFMDFDPSECNNIDALNDDEDF